ncbi:hypothetical protein RHMOL_Rhmol06G0058800 [Rhododendron molle]|uniref:Uncharacterized protein n=1 Tax=Rhododendron molle TaxID=49168 RepID=A0ACC0N997_RHOML|nr:hypothetical protein RHMOL_Rhmol06G0058800 [Rhododendron molle]
MNIEGITNCVVPNHARNTHRYSTKVNPSSYQTMEASQVRRLFSLTTHSLSHEYLFFFEIICCDSNLAHFDLINRFLRTQRRTCFSPPFPLT